MDISLIQIVLPGQHGPVVQKEILAKQVLTDARSRLIRFLTLDDNPSTILLGSNLYAHIEKQKQ